MQLSLVIARARATGAPGKGCSTTQHVCGWVWGQASLGQAPVLAGDHESQNGCSKVQLRPQHPPGHMRAESGGGLGCARL